MSAYNDTFSSSSWDDIDIVKTEEDESESEREENPEDLSLKTRNISVQTEDCMQDIISSYFPHLSVDQIHTFMDLLATILVKTKEPQPTTNEISECYNTILEVNPIFALFRTNYKTKLYPKESCFELK